MIVDQNNEVVYEGIDFDDCFVQLRHHFMQSIKDNTASGKYRVVDYDTMEPADYNEILRVRKAAREMLAYGG